MVGKIMRAMKVFSVLTGDFGLRLRELDGFLSFIFLQINLGFLVAKLFHYNAMFKAGLVL